MLHHWWTRQHHNCDILLFCAPILGFRTIVISFESMDAILGIKVRTEHMHTWTWRYFRHVNPLSLLPLSVEFFHQFILTIKTSCTDLYAWERHGFHWAFGECSKQFRFLYSVGLGFPISPVCWYFICFEIPVIKSLLLGQLFILFVLEMEKFSVDMKKFSANPYVWILVVKVDPTLFQDG